MTKTKSIFFKKNGGSFAFFKKKNHATSQRPSGHIMSTMRRTSTATPRSSRKSPQVCKEVNATPLSASTSPPALLQPHTRYPSIFFSGAGFYLPFHFGAVRCLIDHGITFDAALGVSSGGQACLAVLGGACPDLGLRQCYDLQHEMRCFTQEYFWQSYTRYFEKFRASGQCSLASLNSRIHIAVYDLRANESAYQSEFQSEEVR